MKQFIAENLEYPEEALNNKTEGTVFVKFDIDHQGNVIEAKAISGPGLGCEEEAIRLVKLLKYRVEKPRGLRVIYHKNLQIHFRLPATPRTMPVEQAVQYNYTVVGKESPKPKPSSGYSITIQLG